MYKSPKSFADENRVASKKPTTRYLHTLHGAFRKKLHAVQATRTTAGNALPILVGTEETGVHEV